jgi:hypothetical protein
MLSHLTGPPMINVAYMPLRPCPPNLPPPQFPCTSFLDCNSRLGHDFIPTSVCDRCGGKYVIHNRYHARTCTTFEVTVKYPDPNSDVHGAISEHKLTRDPADSKFHCVYCNHSHRDTEALKVRLCTHPFSIKRLIYSLCL